MPKVKLTGDLSHNGKTYRKGTVFEGDEALVNQLIQLGTAADPDLVVDEASQADAEAEAAKVLAKAEEDAKKALKAAQEQATKLVDEAKADADKIRSDAEVDAKAKGDDILKAAQEQADKLLADAKKAAEPKASDKK